MCALVCEFQSQLEIQVFLVPSTRTISSDIVEIFIFLQIVVSEISIWQIVVMSLVIKSDVFKDEYIVFFDRK